MIHYICIAGLTWSQEGEDFALHAMPIMHHTNVSQACSMLDGVTAYEASAYEQALAEYDDTATTSDDWDFGVDCGDFMMWKPTELLSRTVFYFSFTDDFKHGGIWREPISSLRVFASVTAIMVDILNVNI